jgi:hypothetical protein
VGWATGLGQKPQELLAVEDITRSTFATVGTRFRFNHGDRQSRASKGEWWKRRHGPFRGRRESKRAQIPAFLPISGQLAAHEKGEAQGDQGDVNEIHAKGSQGEAAQGDYD